MYPNKHKGGKNPAKLYKEMKGKLREKHLKEHYTIQEKQERIAKTVLICGLVLGGLILSKYFLNGFAETVRAFKNVTRAFRE